MDLEPVAEEPQLIRQWRILRSFSARRFGTTLKELTADTGVCERTIRRDLATLQQIGFPIKEEIGKHGRKQFRLDSEDGLINLRFTLEEAAALWLGRQFLEPLAGTYFHVGAISALKKIQATFGESALRHVERLANSFYHAARGWTDYSRKAELIDLLVTAIEDRLMTAISYRSLRSTEEVTQYDLYPLSLIYWHGALYLIADSPGHNGIRTFKIDRIESVEVLRLSFAKAIEFDPEAFISHSFGIFQSDSEPQTVRVAFRGDVGRLLEERRFHPSQRLSRGRDGRWLAEFQLSTFEEFLSWILSWGAAAEVLEPAELRERIARAHGDAAAIYKRQINARRQST